eukprot:TRINITY_DN6082_c0_g1_i1.p2 TRINITY_DN6082_c0_g1~~TRINITY_DN6082_c0_g1_i1.p2  ORF type:complete len:351 (+),score=91.50 TRINITY_DN6082_c0_g1_i1:51-1103(+)
MHILVAASSAAVAAAAPLKCGVASADLHSCPDCMQSLVQTGKLDFWWSWGTSPQVDTFHFSAAEKASMYSSFVPMFWGQGKLASYDFLSNGSYIMGFNEPDMYGPACDGDWNPPAYGCAKGAWRGATSSGWQPLFDPSSAAGHWQDSIKDLTSKQPRKARKVVSPSMAMGAVSDGHTCVGVDPSKPGAIKHCNGWLAVFKNYTLSKDCVDFSGQSVNCWDVIDAIQIHAYALSPQEVLDKIHSYYTTFQEDFEGANGRKKKTLWLTEVAMGSNHVPDIEKFVTGLMSPATGLHNRTAYGYVEKVSWFSSWSFQAFNMSGKVPRTNEVWSSGLFYPFGDISPVGKAFFENC